MMFLLFLKRPWHHFYLRSAIAGPHDIRYSFSNESAESIREKCLTLPRNRGLLTAEKASGNC